MFPTVDKIPPTPDSSEPCTPRAEYPRPILVRDQWQSLNGSWFFRVDPDNRGLTEAWCDGQWDGASVITVPFSMESAASGIAEPEGAAVVWYQREVIKPEAWGSRVVLHIGASDFLTRVFVNGQEIGQHRGGYASFGFDIQHALLPGANRITIRVEDSLSWTQPRGKQAGTTRWPIDYEGVSGIWQSVWLEPLTTVSIESTAYSYQVAEQTLSYKAVLSAQVDGEVIIEVLDGDSVVASDRVQTAGRAEIRAILYIENPRLWSPEQPDLYGVRLTLLNHATGERDEAMSYTGLREVSVTDGQVCLNGTPLYLRGVLDQGYFPEGWYTATTDEAFRRDVELTLAMGFNCARKHQKAEDPRYLYWADKLGLMVWAEMPSGRVFSTELIESLTSEWMDLIKRDRAHPSIIAWVPFNESWGVWHQSERPEQRAFVDAITSLTKALDGSRVVIGNDGWEYSSGDLWTLHLYNEDSDVSSRLAALVEDPHSSVTSEFGGRDRVGALPGADVSGLPILLTECGGIGMGSFSEEDFSYGNLAETPEALEARMRKIMMDIRSLEALQGFVWTQLTDVQQEINGLLYFDRQPKLPVAIFSDIFGEAGDV
ncbi:MAG TPA: glycoside hydrolase family 2 [Halieaceae bacterium]|nr:glycoside hydrolase family 2 [Halieaceae bacterium]